MNRVMATRAASICRSVIHAGSRAFRPYSPNDNSPPRQAFPRRRPRCCLRYFTFLGINIKVASQAPALDARAYANGGVGCRALVAALRHVSTLIDPALHADHALGRIRLGEAIIDIGAQR